MPQGLSVNSVYNLLVSCWYVSKIKEFTTDTQLTREINLQSDIIHPWHTVELTTDQFVVVMVATLIHYTECVSLIPLVTFYTRSADLQDSGGLSNLGPLG